MRCAGWIIRAVRSGPTAALCFVGYVRLEGRKTDFPLPSPPPLFPHVSPLSLRPWEGFSTRLVQVAIDRRTPVARPAVAIDRSVVRRYLTSVKTTVSSKGQIVLPAELRQLDRIEAGQEFDVERIDRADYRLVRRKARPNDGAVDWLLACPEKGYFVQVKSESTDTLSTPTS
jgi:AbrB family looped-hinge helix DNA binding protein